jgi:hypothetical protein
MHPVRETSMHYFSCSGGTGRDLTKSASGHITSNLCSCIQWDTQVTYCIPVHLGCETSTHYVSCSDGTGMDLTKSAPNTLYRTCVFCIRWDLRVTWCIPMHPEHETLTHYFSCSGGTGMDLKKARRELLRRTCVFASCGICGSRCAFWCVHVTKCRHTIFHARGEPVQIAQKLRRNTLC